MLSNSHSLNILDFEAKPLNFGFLNFKDLDPLLRIKFIVNCSSKKKKESVAKFSHN